MNGHVLTFTDWRLTTAEILYHRPDFPKLLQSFTWQELDVAPAFPRLTRFLDFWARRLEGPLHSVTVVQATPERPARWTYADGEFLMH